MTELAAVLMWIIQNMIYGLRELGASEFALKAPVFISCDPRVNAVLDLACTISTSANHTSTLTPLISSLTPLISCNDHRLKLLIGVIENAKFEITTENVVVFTEGMRTNY